METKVRYTIVGLFVILLSTALIFAGLWIGLRGQMEAYQTYAVAMEESVSCLGMNSPVKFNGVTVGNVSVISLDQNDPRIVHLLLKVEEGTPITEATSAILEYQGLTGVCFVELKTKTIGAPPLRKKPGQRYAVIAWSPSIALQLDEALRQLSSNIKSITNAFTQLLSPENQESIRRSLANIAQFTNMLVANKEAFAHLVQNSSTASKRLPAVIQETQNAMSKLGSASGQANTTIENISQQTLPTTQEALARLIEVLNNLQQITSQLQNNPSILVRGKQTPPLGPGEK